MPVAKPGFQRSKHRAIWPVCHCTMTTSKVAPEPAEMLRAASSSSIDMSEIATGDALLLEGAALKSMVIKIQTQSRHTHIALAVRYPDGSVCLDE